MAKKLSIDEKIKKAKNTLKNLNQKKKNEKEKELVEFANSIKKIFEKNPKFTLKDFVSWTKTSAEPIQKAMGIYATPTPPKAPTQNR